MHNLFYSDCKFGEACRHGQRYTLKGEHHKESRRHEGEAMPCYREEYQHSPNISIVQCLMLLQGNLVAGARDAAPQCHYRLYERRWFTGKQRLSLPQQRRLAPFVSLIAKTHQERFCCGNEFVEGIRMEFKDVFRNFTRAEHSREGAIPPPPKAIPQYSGV